MADIAAQAEPQNAPPPELRDRWRAAVDSANGIAKRDNLSRAELARRSEIPAGTLTPLLDGKYTGNYATQIAKIERWVKSVSEVADRVIALPENPTFVETPTAREALDTMHYAQQMPLMAVITLGSGMGKTTTAEEFQNRSPGAHLVTMRPTTARVRPMLQEIAQALDVGERNPSKLDRAIGAKLKRNGQRTVLLVDEAQNLIDEAINQLRFFLDVFKCGIVLLGNEEIYSRFGKEPREGYGQIHRRIGKRFRQMNPRSGDIEAIIDAWEIEDEAARGYLRAIGRKPGALGQIAETAKLAKMLAAGDGVPLAGKHVKSAWENRGGEGLQ